MEEPTTPLPTVPNLAQCQAHSKCLINIFEQIVQTGQLSRV